MAKSRFKDKVVSYSKAFKLSARLGRNKKIGFATGVFDVLHLGHVFFLDSIKKKVDVLMVGVDDNETSKRIKGEDMPYFDETERAQMIAALSIVDYVFVFKGPCSPKILSEIKPTYYGVSPFDPVLTKKKKDAKKAGVKVFVSPYFLKSYSTSKVGRALRFSYLLSRSIYPSQRKDWNSLK